MANSQELWAHLLLAFKIRFPAVRKRLSNPKENII